MFIYCKIRLYWPKELSLKACLESYETTCINQLLNIIVALSIEGGNLVNFVTLSTKRMICLFIGLNIPVTIMWYLWKLIAPFQSVRNVVLKGELWTLSNARAGEPDILLENT